MDRIDTIKPSVIRHGKEFSPNSRKIVLSQHRKSGYSVDANAEDAPLTTGRTRKRGLSKRKRPRSFWYRYKRFATNHTWTTPLILVLFIVSLYAISPTQSNIIHHFIFLSYKQQQQPLGTSAGPDSHDQYGKGPWDIAFVLFYTIVISLFREVVMQGLLYPLALFFKLTKRAKQERFMEQMYAAVYHGPAGVFGLYVMRQTPVWYFNTRGMYESFPNKTHDALFKFYYLFQAAYWAQQALVMILGLEKRRKDFKELVAHHIVTLTLIALSWRFHFTYLGIAVYVTHDLSDCFLALSKSLHYIDSPFVGAYFGTSILAWIYLRHYHNLRIIFSLFTEFRTVGPYELNWETQQYKCLTSNIITLVLLCGLQALNLFWLYCLLRSAFNFLVYNVAKDDRSEVDESELEEMKELLKEDLNVAGTMPLSGGFELGVSEENVVDRETGSSTAVNLLR